MSKGFDLSKLPRHAQDAAHREYMKQIGKATAEPKAKRSKYGATKCKSANGESFDSKLERDVYEALVAKHGERRVMRQVSLTLPGGIRMRPDFMVITPPAFEDIMPGQAIPAFVRFFDAKGPEPTRDWKNKAKLLANHYGITVGIIRKASEV